MKKCLVFLLILVFMVSILPAAFAEDGQKDIVDTAVEAGNFTTLAAALDKAGLVDTLKGDGPFTVFAPTDDAFAKLLNDLGVTAEELLNNPDLSDILLYHVLQGKVMAADVVALEDGTMVATVGGNKVKVTFKGSDVYVDNAKVVTTDIMASNGVIHVIDTVLIPPKPVPISNPKTGDPGILSLGLIALASGSWIVARKK